MFPNHVARKAIDQIAARVTLLAFSQEWLKQGQQGIFPEDPLHGLGRITRNPRGKHVEMWWNDLLERKIRLPK